MEFKDNLSRLRAEHGMKQSEVAQFINVDTSMISKYEQGVNYPDYSTLIKLAECFNTSIDYLFGRTSIRTSMKDLEKTLAAEGGMIPLDLIFKLKPDDRELVRRLLETIAKNPDYADKPGGRHKHGTE